MVSILNVLLRVTNSLENKKMKRFTFSKTMLLSLVLLLNVFSSSEANAQCFFNCIDTVNVSVNNACNAIITPGMVLKNYDPTLACNYGIELFDQNDRIINLDFTRADIGPQYVGQALKVRVFQAGVTNPNSCWSIVNIEDKLPPDIVCLGNDTISCYGTDVFADEVLASNYLKSRIERTLIDNCGNEEVTINITRNDLVRQLCQDEFAAMRIVGYNVLDNNLNITACTDTVRYERFILDSLDAPKNYVGDMAIDCAEPYPSVEYLLGLDSESFGNNSTPNIEGVSIADYADSLFTERGLCNFKMTTNDLRFETCGNTYKIVRVWTVIDWCQSRNTKTFNQVIKVVDESVTQNAISNLGVFAADKGSCTTSVELPFPVVPASECNNWSYTISIREPNGTLFFPFGSVRDSVPAVVTRVFAMGVSTIRYVVEDACGNTNTQEFDVTIEDQEAPIPVCDFRTVVTLNDSFLGKVYAKSFDDGSYDYCSDIVSLKVRRVDRAESSCPTPDDFDDFVKFCCADIGNSVMVELQVTDAAGMSSSCMTEAVVQFKGAGPSVTCPANIGTQACTNFEAFDINTLATPSISSSNPCIADALSLTVREVDRSIDRCGDGYIDIEWFYNITGEDQVICAQRVTFANTEFFTEANISWPEDREVSSCDEAPPTAEELAAIVTASVGCSDVRISEPVDDIIDNVPGLCQRIIRTWTVVDWCRFPANQNARWTFDQKIDVVNSNGPAIDISGSNISLDPKPDSCRAHILIEGIAIDDCTLTSQLSWTYKLDLLQDGERLNVIAERQGRVLETRIDAGVYEMTWSATDGCGNTSTSVQNFTIADDIAPQAICGFAIKDIDTSGEVVVTASELDAGSTDNCNDGLTYSMRSVGSNSDPQSSMTFTCANLGVNSVELWVTDRMGNQSVCVSSIDIRDGLSQCGFGASTLSLNGNISTPDDVAVESAEVYLSMNNADVQSDMTEIDGVFAFENLVKEQSYTLTAKKDDDYINGISTLDIILMQRHILGIQSLDSPYKLIAADINDNGAVSAVDLVILRRLILGHIESFPDVDSWRFIDKNYEFYNADSPWPFTEVVELGQITDARSQELIAIKVGDLNSNAIANSGFASSRSKDSYKVVRRTSIDNGTLRFEVLADQDIESVGYQVGLNYESSILNVVDVRSNEVEIVDEMTSDKDGLLKISVPGSRVHSYKKGDIMFQVTFALNPTTIVGEEDIRLISSVDFKSEIYNADLEAISFEMSEEALDGSIILNQNRPNPFEDETLIEFEIPKDDKVTFEVFDINGGRVHSVSKNYSSGRHQITINKEDIGLIKGIYYYQIHTQQRSLIRKMIIL